MPPHKTKPELELEKLHLEVEALKKPAPGFWKKVMEQWQSTLIAIIVAGMALFPNYLIEQAKNALNQSDQRFEQFKELSVDLSKYDFNTRLLCEYWDKGWTTTNELRPVVDDYNSIYTTVMEREQLNRAIVSRYWGKAYLTRFDSIMGSVTNIDAGIHELNSEADKLLSGVETRADPKIVEPILAPLKPKIDTLTHDLHEFLSSLM